MVERAPSKRLNGDGHDREEMAANDLVMSTARGPEPTADQWAEAITASWQKAVESIIRTGRLLVEAKAALRHGEWGDMIERLLPFSHRTANCLMAIADHPVLSNSQYVANLPPSWGTLYDLAAGLPEEKIEAAIAAGRINPGMTRADAAEIIKAHNEEGLFLYERVPEALGTLAKFMREYPDARDFAGHVVNEMEAAGAPDLDDLPKVSAWVNDLHAGLAAERERMDQLERENEEAEDRRMAEMPEDELREQAEWHQWPLERSRAYQEARRRNLPWADQQGRPSKKKRKKRSRQEARPPMFALLEKMQQRTDERGEAAEDVVERDGKITFREPREIADPHADL